MLKKSFRRSAVPLRWEVRGLPSVASPLGGTTIHRIVVAFRLALAFFNSKSKKRGFCFSPFFIAQGGAGAA